MKLLFQKIRDQLKCKAMEVSEEELMKPNELPPHIKKYFMDYVNVYEIMDQLSAQDKIILGLKDEVEKTQLQCEIYKKKLYLARHALIVLQGIGSRPKSKYVKSFLEKLGSNDDT